MNAKRKTADIFHASIPHRVEAARREHLRWLCLLYLDHSRPSTMMDSNLLPLIQGDYPDASQTELRRSLDYLEAGGFLVVTSVAGRWRLKLTSRGIDFVEYTSEATPGIWRPESDA